MSAAAFSAAAFSEAALASASAFAFASAAALASAAACQIPPQVSCKVSSPTACFSETDLGDRLASMKTGMFSQAKQADEFPLPTTKLRYAHKFTHFQMS
jgi:hypothetical protein